MTLISSKIAATDIPVRLESNVRQHYERLGGLVSQLQALGMDQTSINAHVLEVFEEYERELVHCIAELEANAS